MFAIVTYDITDPKRLRRLHKFLKDMGIDTQKSVFECELDASELREIRHYCRDQLDLETDSVRIYHICSSCLAGAIIQGQGVRLAQLEFQLI